MESLRLRGLSSSHAARALTAVLWAVNRRWALQTASGHTWHLACAWMPWCFFFERAREARLGHARSRRIVDFGLGGAAIATLAGLALLYRRARRDEGAGEPA